MLQEIQQDLKSTIERVSSMETYWQKSYQVLPPSLGETPDAISVLTYSDEELVSEQEGSITSFMPLSRAKEPPNGVSELQREVSKPSNENVIQENGTTETAQRMAAIFMIRTPFVGTKSGFCIEKPPSEIILR